MKQFNLELAKSGHPVCTRDGRLARILCFDRKSDNYPIVALITKTNNSDEDYMSYTIDGKFYDTGNKDSCDLMMSTEKKEGWVNIYKINNICCVGGCVYDSKDEAITSSRSDNLVDTIKIEWEE